MFFTTGCGGGSAENGVSSGSPLPVTASTSLEIIDDESFNALSEEDRVYVANKLYTTFFKGKDLAAIEREIDTGRFISDFRNRLYATDVYQPDLDRVVPDTYEIPDGNRFGDPRLKKFNSIFIEIATTLYYTKLSKEYYDAWMAYILDQTILFSPSWEVESVNPFPELISSNFYRLKKQIGDNLPVKKIAFDYMVSKENWARFRSPEDNGREMLEIWLYDFNDLHVPLAARALKNWRWVIRYEPVSATANDYVYYHYNDKNNAEEANTEPFELLGATIKSGEDFYKAIVEHEDFLPGVVMRLVNIYFPTFTEERRREIVDGIMERGPQTFKDIFESIIFSKLYLLKSDRVKSYEEIFFGMAHKLDMTPNADIFGFFHQPGTQVYEGGLDVSKQHAFTYKLGRSDKVPSDSDSVIRLHLNIRDGIFLNRRGEKGWSYATIHERYASDDPKEFLNNMFLDFVGREMTQKEERELLSIAQDAGCFTKTGYDHFTMTLMTFDYFSRLSEIYIYRKIESDGEES